MEEEYNVKFLCYWSNCLNTLHGLRRAFFALLIGLPWGSSYLSQKKKQLNFPSNPRQLIVNIGRSFPFAILLIADPLYRGVVRTSSWTASLLPLAIAAAPYNCCVVQLILQGISISLIEAATVMVYTLAELVESAPAVAKYALHAGYTVAIVNLVEYTAMAGTSRWGRPRGAVL